MLIGSSGSCNSKGEQTRGAGSCGRCSSRCGRRRRGSCGSDRQIPVGFLVSQLRAVRRSGKGE